MKRIPEEKIDKVILYRANGFRNIEIANNIGLSEASVSQILQCFDAVKVYDWEKVKKLIKVNLCSLELIRWCCRRLGVHLPEYIEVYYRETRADIAQQRKKAREARKAIEEPTEPVPAENPPEALQKAPEPDYETKVIVDALTRLTIMVTNGQKMVYDLLKSIKQNNDLNTDIIVQQINKYGGNNA